MTITVEWYEEEKLNIHAEFPWHVDVGRNINLYLMRLFSLLDSVDYPANLIINLSSQVIAFAVYSNF